MIVFDINIDGGMDTESIKFELAINSELSKYGKHPGIYMFYNKDDEVRYIGCLMDLKKKLPYLVQLGNKERMIDIVKIRCFALEDDETVDKQAMKDLLGMLVVKMQPKDNFFNVKRKDKLWSYVEGTANLIINLSRKKMSERIERYSCRCIKKLDRDFMKHVRQVLLTGDGKEVKWVDYETPTKENLTLLSQNSLLDSSEIAKMYRLPKRYIEMKLRA